MLTTDTSIALVLGAASSLSVAALFPYLLAVAPKIRMASRPLWQIILTQSARAGLFMSILAWIGLRLGTRLGLDAPLLRAWLSHEFDGRGLAYIPLAAVVGAGTGVLILLLDRFAFQQSLPAGALECASHVPRWKGLLGCFYGAVVEETLSRLFLMTLLVWILAWVLGRTNAGVFLTACLLSAIAFAAGHLPAAAQLSPLSRPAVMRVLALNTLAGIVFGVLFWRYGLEHAMLAHFATDFVLHVVPA
jgi:membrane protease YdiL (CAAX protease family)